MNLVVAIIGVFIGKLLLNVIHNLIKQNMEDTAFRGVLLTIVTIVSVIIYVFALSYILAINGLKI